MLGPALTHGLVGALGNVDCIFPGTDSWDLDAQASDWTLKQDRRTCREESDLVLVVTGEKTWGKSYIRGLMNDNAGHPLDADFLCLDGKEEGMEKSGGRDKLRRRWMIP